MASGIVYFLGSEVFGQTSLPPRSKTMFLGVEAFGETPPPPRSRTMFLGAEVLGGEESTPNPPSPEGLIKAGDATVIAVYVGDQPLQSINVGDTEINI